MPTAEWPHSVRLWAFRCWTLNALHMQVLVVRYCAHCSLCWALEFHQRMSLAPSFTFTCCFCTRCSISVAQSLLSVSQLLCASVIAVKAVARSSFHHRSSYINSSLIIICLSNQSFICYWSSCVIAQYESTLIVTLWRHRCCSSRVTSGPLAAGVEFRNQRPNICQNIQINSRLSVSGSVGAILQCATI